MRTELYKVEGAGIDFLLGIGGWASRLADDPDLVHRLCNRRRGLGADGVVAGPAGPARFVARIDPAEDLLKTPSTVTQPG